MSTPVVCTIANRKWPPGLEHSWTLMHILLRSEVCVCVVCVPGTVDVCVILHHTLIVCACCYSYTCIVIQFSLLSSPLSIITFSTTLPPPHTLLLPYTHRCPQELPQSSGRLHTEVCPAGPWCCPRHHQVCRRHHHGRNEQCH